MGTLLTNINKLGTSYRRLPPYIYFSRMANFKIILLLAIVAVLLSLRAETKRATGGNLAAKSLPEEADGTKKAAKLSNILKKFSLDKKAAKDLAYKVAKRMAAAKRNDGGPAEYHREHMEEFREDCEVDPLHCPVA